jgi:hypothetical protein
MSKSHRVREALLAAGVTLTLAIASPAVAFTPEPAPAKPAGQTPAELADPVTSKNKGTDITIPGIGSVGAIPKLDFGLELLYGNNNAQTGALKMDESPRVQDQAPRAPENDVQIKGTFTHKF